MQQQQEQEEKKKAQVYNTVQGSPRGKDWKREQNKPRAFTLLQVTYK